MKNLVLLLSILISTSLFANPTPERQNKLREIQDFCKTRFNETLWFDFNECDQNSIVITQGGIQFDFKLSSLEEVTLTLKERRKTVEGRVVLRTYSAAKIRSEKPIKSIDISFPGIGLIENENGIGLQNTLTIYGNEAEATQLCEMLNELLKQ